MPRSRIDLVTLEVFRNRLESIVREMGDVTLRTARSAVVYSGRDFSCGLLDRNAQLLAVGTSIPIHIFPTLWQVQKTVSRFRGDIHPGDIFIGNDPSDGGTHLNDVLIFTPVHDDGELVAFAANRAHWYDVGGMTPGSISGSATEIFQEGLRIPPIRLGQNNELDPDILELILRNVRVPQESRGDILAQVASCRVGGQRILSLIQRHGRETVLEQFGEILESSERRMRTAIGRLPKGSVTHEGYMDNDGVVPEPRRIRVTITVDGDGLVVDYNGTAPQSPGVLNVGLAMTHCFAFMGVKAALDSEGPINSGCFRPIRVTAPDGTMLNARVPAASGGVGELGQAAILTMVALGKLVPELVSAEEGASGNHQTLSGVDQRHNPSPNFIYYDYPAAGGGGRLGKDGLDFVRSLRSGNVNISSVEVLESIFPIVFDRHELRQDSGGPGEFRGGLGLIREYQAPSDGAFSVLSDHAVIPPGGLFGGNAGAPARFEILREGDVQSVSPRFGSKATGFPIRSGDVIRLSTSGGGGYGDPLRRDPFRVLEDVIDEKVSPDQASAAYGVVFTDRMEVDETATLRARGELARKRLYFRPILSRAPVLIHGMRVSSVHPGASALGAIDAGLAEVVNPSTATPLRIRLCFSDAVPPDAISLDREAWELLGLVGDELVVLRVLSSAAPVVAPTLESG